MAVKKKSNIVRLSDRLHIADRLAKLQLTFDRAAERLSEVKEEVRKYAVDHYVDGATSIEILGIVCGVPTLIKFPEPSRAKEVSEDAGDELIKLLGTAHAEKFLTRETKIVYKVNATELDAYLEANPELKETVEERIPLRSATPSVVPPKIDDNIFAAIEKAEKKAEKEAKAQGSVQQVAQ